MELESFIGRFNVARQQDSIEGNTTVLPMVNWLHLESSCMLHCILQHLYIFCWLKNIFFKKNLIY